MDTIEFREAMAQLGASVNVVTTDGESGKGGFTATAVCSVTDQPPTILVCMNRSAYQYSRFVNNGVLCVNALRGNQQETANVFAGATQASIEERFKHDNWSTLKTGAPVLENCLISLDCVINEINEVGTHGVLFCEVQNIRLGNQGENLMYFRRKYHSLTAD